MGKLKKSLVAAVCSTIALVCMLMVFALSTATETKSEIRMIILFLAILILAASAIVQWIKYLKGYVDFAIGQKLREADKETKD